MTVKEVDELFEVDGDGRFVRLVLPADEFGNEVDLIGKKQLGLDLTTIIRIKKYAGNLYEEALKQ